MCWRRWASSSCSSRTRIETTFDPTAVRRLKAQAESPISIGGATLAARAFDEGLVDEVRLVVQPVVVGAGRAVLGVRSLRGVELVDERTFGCGTKYLAYRVASAGGPDVT